MSCQTKLRRCRSIHYIASESENAAKAFVYLTYTYYMPPAGREHEISAIYDLQGSRGAQPSCAQSYDRDVHMEAASAAILSHGCPGAHVYHPPASAVPCLHFLLADVCRR